ncbi:MAG: hypothetical protein GY820_14705 [Gammaproteobacteria bacterium]|nr:hypothetical protein [Gammaproteobacteria bacterium]
MSMATTYPKLIQIGSAQIEICPSEWCSGKEKFEFLDFGAKNGPARKLGYLYGLHLHESFRLKKNSTRSGQTQRSLSELKSC